MSFKNLLVLNKACQTFFVSPPLLMKVKQGEKWCGLTLMMNDQSLYERL